MAQRSSRSSKKKSRKQPELRTGGGRQAKAARTREREESGTTLAGAGPVVRVRPPGVGGVLVMLLLAYLGVAAIAALGAWVGRWDVLSYPDSMWLYAAFGMVAVAPALGRVARSEGDANAWGAQALLVPLGLLTAESVVGPECPEGGACGVIGARGALGLVGSIALVAVLAAVALLLARWNYSRARNNRPTHGRVRYRAAIAALVFGIVFIGGPLANAFGGVDILLRDAPAQVKDVREQVALHCFPLGDAPDLAVRAAPVGAYTGWSTYAVRRADEDRAGVKGAKLPTDWATLDGLHPYEATVSVTGDGSVLDPECRRVSPDAGAATADDLARDTPAANPLDPFTTGSQFYPQFYTQAPPTAKQLRESKEALAAARKAEEAAAKNARDEAATKGAFDDAADDAAPASD
jgi:hypothetical protein